jgi:hemerythrin superfamily protein
MPDANEPRSAVSTGIRGVQDAPLTTGVRAMKNARGKERDSGSTKDAVELLKADHRQVEVWFEEFEEAEDSERKQELAMLICDALTVHTAIEEELFYPAFLEATDDKDIHHEAEIEHAGAKRLIAEIQATESDDEYFDSRVKVLSEMIKHHVREEEKPDGMFAEAKDSDMDLVALGEQLAALKAELEADTDEPGDPVAGRAGASQQEGDGRMKSDRS